MAGLGIGIIGFGRIGAEHAGWIGTSKGASVAAVADITPARRALAQSRGFKTFDEVDALLADPDVQAVLVATPTAFHFNDAARALHAGRHVMVEKPIALNLSEARQLVDLATASGRVLSVFHNRRWDIDYLTVKHALASGVLGKLINVESRLGQFASCVGPAAKEYRPGWRNEESFGGGGLFDWGSHFVDQIWQLLLPRRPVRVFAQLRGNVWSSDCDDFARVLIDFDDGCVGMVEINTTTTRPLPRWHLDGSHGSASSPASPAFDTNVWAQLDFTPEDGGARSTRLPTAPAGLTETEIWEEFAGAIRDGRQPAVAPSSVLTTMQLLDAARQSSRKGVAIEIELY